MRSGRKKPFGHTSERLNRKDGVAVRFLVLGAAAGGGLPQWNCAAENCSRLWRGVSDTAAATQSCVAVGNGPDWALLNASPDLRQQIIAQPELHPLRANGLSARRSPIRSVLITDSDIDHIAGLLSLRERTCFTLFGTRSTLDRLRANPIFDVLAAGIVERCCLALDEGTELVNGVPVNFFSVPGKTPLYLEHPIHSPETDAETDETIGVEFTDRGRRAIYIPSCCKLTERLKERIAGADLLFFDGTVFHDDELIREKVGEKTGRRMGHLPIAGSGGSLEALADVRVGRKIYIHINNTNPIWQNDSVERREIARSGWEVAHDGMEVAL
jgi:pyrroloquinoline quinone biosynthesis protein B